MAAHGLAWRLLVVVDSVMRLDGSVINQLLWALHASFLVTGAITLGWSSLLCQPQQFPFSAVPGFSAALR